MQYPTTRYSLGSTKSSLPSISSIPSSSSVYIPYYDYYPHETIPLEQFQTLAMERLKILKCTEQALAKLNTTLTTASTTKTDEIEKLLRKELKEKLTYLKFR
ncbi:unnamed protein product [Didymodactylos carnosus]|uniref:Uncharacterized protein n=1 Tax=Didymodactylos carnosus TaxID=1234261 RepID=A0A813T112_9BILA|nr:unnamed protein product [Didymodactylos carnosus]CAF0903555.1 unnamed protein product [Didymodactylos carnosus]CAF3590296.1 unnamed protein product [Didymodactylos carnosus]CAF3683771.1 unnamed protein product [Didymodactylos carnosus]